jgi:peptidoglycan/xylan/chitin deacetylase (PgdA/CDA1 family)
MNFYPVKFPYFFQLLFPSLKYYHKTGASKIVYLTFDDGPTPEITEWVLKQLDLYQAKATFFCIGKNILEHKDIVHQVFLKGHKIANHSFNHLKGWGTKSKDYLNNVLKTDSLLNDIGYHSKLFRPPYGRITFKQIKLLQKNNFDIVMWTSVVGDFSQTLNTDRAIKYLLKKTQPGHILVFHDSLKAEKQLKAILPSVLEGLSKKGYIFKTL